MDTSQNVKHPAYFKTAYVLADHLQIQRFAANGSVLGRTLLGILDRYLNELRTVASARQGLVFLGLLQVVPGKTTAGGKWTRVSEEGRWIAESTGAVSSIPDEMAAAIATNPLQRLLDPRRTQFLQDLQTVRTVQGARPGRQDFDLKTITAVAGRYFPEDALRSLLTYLCKRGLLKHERLLHGFGNPHTHCWFDPLSEGLPHIVDSYTVASLEENPVQPLTRETALEFLGRLRQRST